MAFISPARLGVAFLGLAGLTCFSALHPSYAPLYKSLQQNYRASQGQADWQIGEREEAKRQDAERLAREQEAERQKASVLDAGRAEKNRQRVRANELAGLIVTTSERINAPFLESKPEVQKQQIALSGLFTQAPGATVVGDSGWTMADVMAKKPCSDIQNSLKTVFQTDGYIRYLHFLCLYGYWQDQGSDDEKLFSYMWIEANPTGAEIRRRYHVTLSYVLYHLTEMWERRLLDRNGAYYGRSPGKLDIANYDQLFRTRLPGKMAKSLVGWLEKPQIEFIRDKLYQPSLIRTLAPICVGRLT
ncbi:hypothetical protein [Pararhizobium gei]|uniref:hypothetical protein n=1 Tax=Pararhizobium gei TaxID=1395951 RepID=UPI0023DC71A6|nr:hypothetical protein [Rhizobium gei]